MSILYNSPISYNELSIGYSGAIVINIPGISSPILIGDLKILTASFSDNSNATTVGVITYDYAPTAVITFLNLNTISQQIAEVSISSV